MRSKLALIVIVLFAVLPALAQRGYGGGRGHSSGRSYVSGRSSHGSSAKSTRTKSVRPQSSKTKCVGCTPDSYGRIKRNPAAKRAFQHRHPCPSTGRTSGRCPGYVVDHIRPLKRGGADDPNNMQWQSKEQAKRKDRIE